MCLSHIDLLNYYKLNFQLVHHHKWALSEIEMMVPWEREVYVGLLRQWIEEENERHKQEEQRLKNGGR